MIEGTKYSLSATIMSNFNKEVYGKKGETVTLISISDPVAIVEDMKGKRFPMNMSFLTEIKQVEEQVKTEKVDAPRILIKKSRAKRKENITPSLF